MNSLPPVIIEPESPANATVIWLHGLGADANDFVPVVEQMVLPESLAVRFILPNAPVRPITLNGGMTMPGWYDLEGIGPQFQEDESGLRASQSTIESLIEKEQQKGIDSERIVLIGFSQGGAVVLQAGLRHTKKLAGLIAMSTYLPLRETVENELEVVQTETPIMFMHGSYDPVVPISFAQGSYQILQQADLNLQWQEYPMEHTVCLEQIRHINSFLLEVLS